MPLRILLIGDIVGKPGYRFVERVLPGLRRREQLDLVIANAENAAAGAGLTPKIYHRLIAAGVDCITLGDHIYRRKEISPLLERESNIVKPANYPPEAPGRDWAVVAAADGTQVAVFSLLGRVFMRPVDCPWKTAERVLAEIPAEVRVRVLDFHAEATSDKQLMGRYLDGRVTAVLGTHTHVPTADERILPRGTAFQCDVGMTGPHESILGREIGQVMETTLTFRPTIFHVAEKDVQLHGSIVEINPAGPRATAIRRLRVREEDAEELEILEAQKGAESKDE
ncbi:MAG: TIGR00282 family metallophosphoesterase [Planctomycetes bacterium]|nr:TIGR00282 family metallophosphoesterase [Planctomycetota bacterium]